MRLLIDTHILVWIVLNDRRLSAAQRNALEDGDNTLVLSAASAYELTQLQLRGRSPVREPLADLQRLVGFEEADLPFDIWREVALLPDIHRDPIDRMLVAHARLEGMTLVTGDATVRKYPVECL